MKASKREGRKAQGKRALASQLGQTLPRDQFGGGRSVLGFSNARSLVPFSQSTLIGVAGHRVERVLRNE